MNTKRRILLFLGGALLSPALLQGYDVPGFTPDQIAPFKQTTNSSGGAVELNLHIFNPEDHSPGNSRPAVVFFFGGGWNNGSASHFHPHCDYLASRGMVAISAEYRVNALHGTSPQECVKDGKSAIRWVRENAATLGIDPNRIAAGGGSSGGHVAAAAGTLANYDEPGENLAVSSKPNALILYNPVYDNGPTGYGHDRVQAYWEDFSPLHNIDNTIPPAIVFLGTDDNLIPVATAENFQDLMEAEGIRSDLHLYQDQPHSFFNYDVIGDSSGPFYGYQDTVFKTDRFLVSLGYLSNPHSAPEPATDWVTIFGDSGFSGGSENTSSPTTTDADADGIAANLTEVILADGDFIQLTGSVTLDVPMSGSNFRLGLFDGDDPVTAGDGSGYSGIWAEVPATADTQIASSNGAGIDHPFEPASSITLGPVPGATTTVPAGTALQFTLMIARFGNTLDINVDFTDGNSYHQSQNLLNQALTSDNYNSLAFLMTENLDGTQAIFSNVQVTSGPALPSPPTPIEPSRIITYIDAVEGPSGNTFATGSTPADLSWVLDPGTSAISETQWSKRLFGNGPTVFQGSHTLPDTLPELTTQITGLANGTYEIWSFYWDQIDSDTQNWILSTGLSSGSLTSYSSPGEPLIENATTAGVVNAGELEFTNEVLVVDGGGLRNLFGVKLGQVSVSEGSVIEVHVDNLIGNGSSNRAWFDGVGYARINNYFTWISGFSVGSETGFSDDPDGDGKPNGLENFLGTNPTLSDPLNLSITPSGSPDQYVFTHPENADAAEDISAQYQWSPDLQSFFGSGVQSPLGDTVTFLAQPNTPTPGITTVTATFSGASSPAALFLRIAATQNTP